MTKLLTYADAREPTCYDAKHYFRFLDDAPYDAACTQDIADHTSGLANPDPGIVCVAICIAAG